MRSVVAGLLCILFIGCSGEPPADQPQTTESVRARDSTIAESNLPGAQGVRSALRTADSVDARNARIDSMANEP
jgi:hypothetical protein